MKKDAIYIILKKIHVFQGDITLQKTDAIVNAANISLLGGGGVDGAIHNASGPQLLVECRHLNGCPTGEARITSGYNLPAKYVIHTPGPRYKGGNNGEGNLLKNCYVNSMKLAFEKKLSSISFPAISTGVYGYPKKEACSIALHTTIDFCVINQFFIDIYFVLFDQENYLLYINAYKELLQRNHCESNL